MPEHGPVRCARQGYDPHALEKEILDRWQQEEIPQKVHAWRQDAEPFYFVDGPPYTSGHIHLGTAWNKIMKDLIVRTRRMQGLNVRDQPGWDMHGLPIEVKVEKELGLSNKQEIEELGVEQFVDKCRGFALEFLDEMTEEFKELGVWLDWENPYRTIDDSYMEGAWWALERAHEKGLLYQDNRGGLPWCPRCETALAQAEVEYEDREDPSIYVKLRRADVEDEEYLVIWTTTPWTLPANNAVAVHPDLQYARVLATKQDGSTETIIVEETVVEDVARAARYTDVTVMDHVQGAEMEGWSYVHPFAEEVPYHQQRRTEAEYTILLGEHVAADRTGLVHTATGHGAEDFEIGQTYGIAPFCPVGPDGLYDEQAGELAGLVVRKVDGDAAGAEHADDVVIQKLTEKGLLLADQLTEHSYGHCWRCKTPIIYLTTEQWFLAVTEVKDTMLSEVERVTWTPDWAGAARQKDWVENARDWCISRQRYWGIPLPIWTCQACDQVEVVGSRQSLLDRADVDELPDLHRPWVDQVTLTCSCGGTMERVPDVLDVWFDSAVASWASLGFPAAEEAYDTWFPCDLIIEGLDQTRGWFYSQLGAGVVSHGRVPYEEVVMHGFVHDQEGRPMSKSLGNIVAPSEVIKESGVDAMRWSMLEQTAPWEDLSYGPDAATEAQRVLNILWNVHYFTTQYMEMDGYTACPPDWEGERPEAALDRWILSRLASTVQAVTDHLATHHFHRGVRALRTFILEDLSRWFVRLNRDRAWKGEGESKQVLYDVLTVSLATVARLLAPIAPHTAEALWQDLYPGGSSVHLQDWPRVPEDLEDQALEADMETVRDIVEATSRTRERAGLSLRWPVPRIVLAGTPRLEHALEVLGPVLREECNAKAAEYVGEHWEELLTVAEPDRSVIGPTFKGQAPQVMEAIRAADADALKRELSEKGKTSLGGFEVTDEMVTFTTAVPEGISGESFEGGSVFVDAHLDETLTAEGLAREVLRRIQEMRKEADLALEEVVSCTLAASPEATALLEDHTDELESEGRVELRFGEVGKEARAWQITSEAIGLEETVRIEMHGIPDL